MENFKNINEMYDQCINEAQLPFNNIEKVLAVNKSRETGCDSSNSINEADCNEGDNDARTLLSKKKKRRMKIEGGEKIFKCNICKKSYFSYPALYTHKRNKHNIIPITCKEDIFKKTMQSSNTLQKFDYSALENHNWDFPRHLDHLIKNYKKTLDKIFSNENCILFQKNFNNENHVGVRILQKIKDAKLIKLMVPDAASNPKIDEILIIYLIYFVKVIQDQKLTDMVVKFAILFREHINIVGWDYKNKFREFRINVSYNNKGPYTLFNSCEEVPDFVNDFVSVFVALDSNFSFGLNELLDLTKNFCNWLFVNNLTSFKICPNEIEED